jgi:hypothetical protein
MPKAERSKGRVMDGRRPCGSVAQLLTVCSAPAFRASPDLNLRAANRVLHLLHLVVHLRAERTSPTTCATC